jgi:hypothetical protein
MPTQKTQPGHLKVLQGDRDKFDIVLACAFEPEEKGNTKFGFYDKIGNIIRNLGKVPYLPHRELDLRRSPGKMFSKLEKAFNPKPDLTLCYLGIPSEAMGIITGMAVINQIPIIYLFEQKTDFFSPLITGSIETGKLDPRIVNIRDYVGNLEFDSINVSGENLNELKKSLNKFYK